jgi:TolA-binding protein
VTERRPDLEDLSALSRRGLLTGAEEREFEHELRANPDLQAAHEVGLDLDRATAVRAGDEALIARVADAALSRVAVSGLAREGVSKRGPVSGFGASSRRRRPMSALLAAALLLVTGVATAVWSGAVPSRWFGRAQEKTIPVASSPRAAAQKDVRHGGPPVPSVATLAAPVAEPVPDVPPEPSAEDVALAPRATARSSAEASVATLFRAGNAARRDGDFTRAKRTYSELIARYPSSDEARLARVSLGKLLLAKGNPSDAEHEFDQYLKGGHGQLTEEALVSRAQSLQKLERAGAERRTWQALLAEYPDSVYAAEARRRLDALRHPAPSSAP